MPKRNIRLFLAVLLAFPIIAVAQKPVPAAGQAPASAASTAASRQAFLQAADQVLGQMSRLLDLPLLHPLKKSIETKAEIRAYLVKENKEDKRPAKRYADKKALEAFGLIPKGFDLDGFMLNLLTNQIAGLYDPKAQEFYIADWIPLSQQRVVMAHELTHALQDQHFHIEKWVKAARPNDDAESARQAVLEGSAVVSMLDYELMALGRSVRELPDIGPMTQAVIGDASSSPDFNKAPIYLRDSLLFPYLSGAVFTQQVLKAGSGWGDFQKVFARPPVSTQQVMHPAMYLAGKAPAAVTLPDLKRLLGHRWKLLDENVLGEFGLQEVLKQFLGDEPAGELAPDWWGDRYAILENKKTKASLLVLRLRLDSEAHATQFFSAYARLLRKKHAGARQEKTGAEFLQLKTAGDGGVFFECRKAECVSMEGGERKEWGRVVKAMGWPKARASRAAARRNAPDPLSALRLPLTSGAAAGPLPAR